MGFFALEMLAWGYQCVHDRGASVEKQLVSSLVSAGEPFMRFIYPEYKDASEIEAMLREVWSRNGTGDLVYNEYTQFKEKAFQGKYITVSEHGFRHVKNQGPWPLDPKYLNIFVFGGSLAFNYGVADQQTLVSYLQEILNEKRPLSDVRIYNFGQGYYFSTQERVLFEQLLLDGHVPDIAIFLDGPNDFAHATTELHFTESIKEYLEGRGKKNKLLAWLQELHIVKLVYDLRGPLKIPNKQVMSREEFVQERIVKEVIERMNIYLGNVIMADAVARSYGVQPVFIVAPSSYYAFDNKYNPFFQTIMPIKQIWGKNGYELLNKIFENKVLKPNHIWLGDIHREKQEPLFSDAGHYSSRFSYEVAEAIAEEMMKRNLLPETRQARNPNLVRTYLNPESQESVPEGGKI